MTRDPSGALQSVAADSRLWRGLQSLGQAWALAWDTSVVSRAMATAEGRVRRATPARRLRTGASIAAWACAWHLAGLMVLPGYVTSGLPRAWFVGAGVIALVVAFAADAFVRAWGSSALRRLLSQFAS